MVHGSRAVPTVKDPKRCFRDPWRPMYRTRRPHRSNELLKPQHVASHRISHRPHPIVGAGFRGIDLLAQKVMQLAHVADDPCNSEPNLSASTTPFASAMRLDERGRCSHDGIRIEGFALGDHAFLTR